MANEQHQSGFEVYHIPQQSRRDKLRFTSLNSSYEVVDPTASTQISSTDFQHHSLGGGGVGYLPLYDQSSLLPPDLLTCAPGSNHHGGFSLHHHQSHNRIYLPPSTSDHLDRLNPNTPPNNFVKEEGGNYNFMGGFAANTRSISFIDPHGSLSTIPGIAAAAQSSITNNTHHNNTDVPPFFLFPQQTKEIDHHQSTGSGNELVLYKSEPLNRQHQQQQQGGLSLSLSSNSASVIQQNSHTTGFARYPAPLGPFTGYASVLTGSKFLRPAQMLLQEICEVGIDGHEAAFSNNENSPRAAGKIIGPPDLSLLDPPSTEGLRVFDEGGSGGVAGSSDDDQRDRRRKSRLISMLDEVVRCYKQYYHQFQAVIASFESVPGLGDAAPFANLALKAISKHFRILRNSITDQLQFTSKSPTDSLGQKEGNHHHRSNYGDKIALYSQRSMSSAARFPENHQPVWRPQRGLPERAVSVLRAWLFEHFLHPYPTDTDKMMLAKQTGLTRSQVSNWFINARVRLWKPMVEEIHALETKQQHPHGHNQNPSSSQAPNKHNNVDHHVPSASSFTSDLHHNHQSNTAGLMKPPQENITPIKRVRNDQEILDFSFVGSNQHQMSMQYSNHHLSGHGIGPSTNGLVGGSSNVSLTLGLHQQNSSGAGGLSSDQFPHIGLAHPFGLGGGGGGDSNEQCAVPVGHGFEGQNQHFTRDVTGGISGHHLLHDFVG